MTDGDRNTAFFHRLHRFSHGRVSISSLLINDVICEDQKLIAEHIQGYYEELFADSRTLRSPLCFIDELISPSVTSENNRMLLAIPSEDEIKSAVFDLSPVFQVAWEVIQHDLINAVGYFFVAGILPAGLNSNVVTLIPKTVGASRIEDFRPIVLGTFYSKIFRKFWLRALVRCFISYYL